MTALSADRFSISCSVAVAPVVPIAAEGWPTNDATDCKAVVRFEPCISDDRTTVAILRVVAIGQCIAAADVAWAGAYGGSEEAYDRCQWLKAHPAICVKLGRHARLFGQAEVTAEIEVAMVGERLRLEKARIYETLKLEEERKEAEENEIKAQNVDILFVEKDGQFAFTLERETASEPFWVILFAERWQRQRFLDWARWQRHRFLEWAKDLETLSSIELERKLIAEMIATEIRVKELGPSGLAERGRRPLRSWRGEV